MMPEEAAVDPPSLVARPPKRHTGRAVLRVALIALLPAVLVAALVLFATRFVEETPPTSEARANSIAWGDRVFASRARLEDWLDAHGASYEEWARKHPGAAPWQPRRETAEPTDADGDRREVSLSTTHFGELTEALADLRTAALLGIILVAGTLLLAASALPPSWYVGRVQGDTVLVRRRVETAALGIGLLAGLLVPMLPS